MKVHIQRIHEGKTDHKCFQCDKMFFDKYRLEDHVKNIHNRSINFLCDICEKGFTSSYSLKKHIKETHHQRKNYKCEICENDFFQSSSQPITTCTCNSRREKNSRMQYLPKNFYTDR